MDNPKRIVAVGLGEVLYDYDTETGEYTFGGAPANFADHFLKCARLVFGPDAAEVHVVSAVGDDERGRMVIDELRERGLCDALCRVPGGRTGVVNKRRDAAGVNSYEILPGAWDEMAWSEELERLACRTEVVAFGSLAQRSEASHRTVRRFLDTMIRSERRTLRVFDVNIRQRYFSRAVIEESLRRCNIVKISDEEAPAVIECLTGYRLADDGASLCRALLARHPNLETAILTEGAAGSRIFRRDRESAYLIPPANRTPAVDTVGAGDSFTAAFCAQLVAGHDLWQAQSFASRIAAWVCSQPGATPAYPASLS
ncbi:carbohydrate kinase family protein [Alistipes sp.]|uniref:carbohydrate kinase family protein n=1 Tax=Alistipes sp. TaxID=1872444 RepID=UPI003AF165FF